MQNKNINIENNISTELDINNKSNDENNNNKEFVDKINDESNININNNSEINKEMSSNIKLNSQPDSLYKEKSKKSMNELIQNMNQINDNNFSK